MDLVSVELLTVEETARFLRIGRTKAWELVQRGEIPSIRIGRRSIRVPAKALRDLLASAEAEVAHR